MRLRREKETAPPEQVPDRPRPLRGVRFDRADQGRRLTALQKSIKAFPPIEGFSMWNGAYESVDAEVLWAILREIKPQRVVEIESSPWASLIIKAATGREPERPTGLEDLAERDVVFALRPTAPVVLDVLPRLGSGVLAHFHGVALPWEQRARDQDLLQAFLCGNPEWEVLFGLHDLTRTEPELVKRLVPSWRGDSRPSAFWLRRC